MIPTAVSFSSPEAPQAGRIPNSLAQAHGAHRWLGQRPAGGTWLTLPGGFIVIDQKCRTTLEQQDLLLCWLQTLSFFFCCCCSCFIFFLLIPLAQFALWKIPLPNHYWPVHGICSTGMEGAGGSVKNAVPALVCCTGIPFLTHHRKICEAVKSWNCSLGFPFWPGTPTEDTAASWGLKWHSGSGCGSWLIRFSANKPALECI